MVEVKEKENKTWNFRWRTYEWRRWTKRSEMCRTNKKN